MIFVSSGRALWQEQKQLPSSNHEKRCSSRMSRLRGNDYCNCLPRLADFGHLRNFILYKYCPIGKKRDSAVLGGAYKLLN